MQRLRDAETLGNFVQFVGQHLGRQYILRLPRAYQKFSEAQKLEFLPLMFGLMPRAGALRSSAYMEIKPLIREHLRHLEIPDEDLLVDLLKDLCDNFDRTQPNDPSRRRFRPRKFGIGDVRQLQPVYARLRESQRYRCAICGAAFDGKVAETLDHIIPWRLGGDPPEGSNWQILCKPCNDGKSDLISSIALVEYFNWVYADTKDVVPDLSENKISLRSRYLLLSCREQCELETCKMGPTGAELVIVRRAKTGFSVFDHLAVYCVAHVESASLPVLTA